MSLGTKTIGGRCWMALTSGWTIPITRTSTLDFRQDRSRILAKAAIVAALNPDG